MRHESLEDSLVKEDLIMYAIKLMMQIKNCTGGGSYIDGFIIELSGEINKSKRKVII